MRRACTSGSWRVSVCQSFRCIVERASHTDSFGEDLVPDFELVHSPERWFHDKLLLEGDSPSAEPKLRWISASSHQHLRECETLISPLTYSYQVVVPSPNVQHLALDGPVRSPEFPVLRLIRFVQYILRDLD